MMARQPALTVAHVADCYRRYPGEPVTLYAQVEVLRAVPGYRLDIGLPPGLEMAGHQNGPLEGMGGYRAPEGTGGTVPQTIQWEDGEWTVRWQVEQPLDPGTRHEYQLQTVVRPTREDVTLHSQAIVAWKDESGGLQGNPIHVRAATTSVAESACIAVSAKGRYLQHLPALYAEDELMGRFVMLFESFWTPIERKTDLLPFYFDPRTAPPDLLPWLASWLDLVLDERWSEEKRRRLLRSAVSLYRKRGTRQGLREYLQIYTGEIPLIVEHRANNFRLGPDARLGPGIALGSQNVPHAFSVTLRLPPIEAADGRTVEQQEAERRRTIERIIEAEKPAHTAYTLHLKPLP